MNIDPTLGTPVEVVMPDGFRYIAYEDDEGRVVHVRFIDGLMVPPAIAEDVAAFCWRVAQGGRV